MAQEKLCLHCGKVLTGSQRKFCCASCRGLYYGQKEEIKICPQCGKEFVGKHYKKYCSQECINKSVVDKLGESGFCLNCGVEIKGINGKKFCSRKCKDRYKYHKEEKICETCGKTYEGTTISKYCSKECRRLGRNAAVEKTCTEKYGVSHFTQLKEVQEKKETTNIEKYGVKNVMQDDEIKEKVAQATIKKYGVRYATQNKDIMKLILEKTRQTNMEKYGIPYFCLHDKCKNASTAISKVNLQFDEYLKGLGFETQLEFPIENRSYDIKVGNTLIEINPFPYHNSTRSPKREPLASDYHYNKLKLARDNGYRCIMVWDRDDYSKIPYLLDENKQQIYARKTEIRQITYDDCHQFFEDYHLQGDTRKDKNNIYIGLYYNDELVECMSFGKPRYNKNYEREILRLCSHKDYRVVGGANKIYKYFLEITNANSVISYCDMSKFDGKVYEQLGFKLLKRNKPSKHWYNPEEVASRIHITDNLLRQRGYDQIFDESYGKGTDNDELMKQRGYVEIYDCGQSTFIWTRS